MERTEAEFCRQQAERLLNLAKECTDLKLRKDLTDIAQEWVGAGQIQGREAIGLKLRFSVLRRRSLCRISLSGGRAVTPSWFGLTGRSPLIPHAPHWVHLVPGDTPSSPCYRTTAPSLRQKLREAAAE